MFAALTDQKSGNSTPRCSKFTVPSRQLVMTTSRRSQVTWSYGWVPCGRKDAPDAQPSVRCRGRGNRVGNGFSHAVLPLMISNNREWPDVPGIGGSLRVPRPPNQVTADTASRQKRWSAEVRRARAIRQFSADVDSDAQRRRRRDRGAARRSPARNPRANRTPDRPTRTAGKQPRPSSRSGPRMARPTSSELTSARPAARTFSSTRWASNASASSSTGRPWHALRTPAITFSRPNGSVAPLRLTTSSVAASRVVNRRPQEPQERRRRIAAPPSASRLSTTRLSEVWQNGQRMSPGHPSSFAGSMQRPPALGLLTSEAVDTRVGNSPKSVGNLLNNLWTTYTGVTTRCCVPDSRAAPHRRASPLAACRTGESQRLALCVTVTWHAP